MLGMIVITALFVRIYRIAENPPALSWDEVSIGYNAYTILTTGQDEHGRFLPLDTFAAYGDYKPPLPVYLTVPFVAVFGLNEFAVRLPSALAGTLTVLLMYFLVLELFIAPKSKRSEFGTRDLPTSAALFSAAILALTPWHIMLSRAGFEANIAFFCISLGVTLVLAARSRPSLWYWAFLPFIAGIYTFNSARYAGPLIAMGALVFVYRATLKERKKVFTGLLIAAFALLPIAAHLISPESRLRFKEVSIFSDLDVVQTANARLAWDGNTMWAKLFDNRRLGYIHSYLVHFADNFEPRFLFISGDGNPKFSIQDSGQLLIVIAPFLAYGIVALSVRYPAVLWLLVWWLVASIIPAAVARETPHALRVENGLPFYIIASAYGLLRGILALRRDGSRVLFMCIVAVLIAGNFLYFWHNLIRHYPEEYSGTWQYGYKQAIEYIQKEKDQYDTVVLSESIGRPYMYVAFYEKTDPEWFLENVDASFDAAGFYNVYGLGTYRFVREDAGTYSGRTLYVLPPQQVPEGVTELKRIELLNGTPVLVIFES